MKASKQLKKLHKKSNPEMSFKQFVRSVKDSESELVKVYLDNRKGKLNKKRSEKTISRIMMEKQATKSAKTKTKK